MPMLGVNKKFIEVLMKILNNSAKSVVIVLTILISGCKYYSSEVKKVSEKYNISLEEAKRCHSTFSENTETVLDWLENNKSWFFGFFSENCDDLITQLPPFGKYDNLLAAKNNNWEVDDPEYKRYLKKRNEELAEERKAQAEQRIQEAINRMNSGTLVKHEDFGEQWPFTVNQGYLDCVGRSAVFRAEMREYGLNGVALSNGYNPIDPIWRNHPEIPGAKINIGRMIQIACSN